jgi:hypothetical protein
VAIGDMDGDGDNDIVIFNVTVGAVQILQTVDGVYAAEAITLQQSGAGPVERAFSLIELDGDGLPDIVSTQVGGCTVVRISSNQGLAPDNCLVNSQGKLTPIDLDGDGDDTDEYVQSESGKVFTRSGMIFTEVRDLSAEGSFTTVGEVYPRDVDGDGDVDIQVSGENANGPVIVNFINYRITQCNDGNDNDGDGLIDLNDFGCESSNDNDESQPAQAPECADGIDNDGDGDVDTDDSACFLPSNGSESNNSCGGETDIETVAAGTFTMSTVGATNDFIPACGGGGLQANAADKLVSFTVSQRSLV